MSKHLNSNQTACMANKETEVKLLIVATVQTKSSAKHKVNFWYLNNDLSEPITHKNYYRLL